MNSLCAIRSGIRRLREACVGHANKLRGIKSAHSYSRYDEYVARQKEKTLDPERVKNWLGDKWDEKVDDFRRIFEADAEYVKGRRNALCLGARTGQEVKALRDMGVSAIGVDLVAFEPYTEEGDVHDLKYADESFDLLFSNIFDHCLYPDRFCSEMERVTQPGGVIILQLQIGRKMDEYAETLVYDPKKVIGLFKQVKVRENREIHHDFDLMNWEVILEKKDTVS